MYWKIVKDFSELDTSMIIKLVDCGLCGGEHVVQIVSGPEVRPVAPPDGTVCRVTCVLAVSPHRPHPATMAISPQHVVQERVHLLVVDDLHVRQGGLTNSAEQQ